MSKSLLNSSFAYVVETGVLLFLLFPDGKICELSTFPHPSSTASITPIIKLIQSQYSQTEVEAAEAAPAFFRRQKRLSRSIFHNDQARSRQ